ncbi:glucokinase [Allocatelliglobosispora scoriae]|uniref:Glucokinase n=1 Tax=Allocatelliglobosispora scoriae TaxID=643052 RepID=A0A841BKL5_9ACTN|nr:ROK family protein [Allocatelliglobosispora scoriae]MBB5867776.1 glucokinase [Allocatelliglobosispora scoriae]
MTAVLAVDIGGTTFAGAVIDGSGTIADHAEFPIGPDPTATLHHLVKVLVRPGLRGAGIGSAGPLDLADGTVSPINIPGWRDFPIVAEVSALLDGVPVALAGDAQCMALGEWWRGGHAEHARALLGIVVSTGIGGGLVLNGSVYLGPTGNAGHIGHITVDPAGQVCPCGATGCVETIASGPAMTRWALANGWRPETADARPDAKALAADARRGDPPAVAAFARAADALATALLTTAALCDVDTVVVGGGVAAAGDTLLDQLRTAIAARTGMPFLGRLRVESTGLGRHAGLYGAAALALTGN